MARQHGGLTIVLAVIVGGIIGAAGAIVADRTLEHTGPSVPQAKRPLVVHGAGDTNVDPGYIPNLRAHGYAYAWSGLNGFFRRDDLTVVNLECAVSKLGVAVPKEFSFRGDPAALPAMRRAGVEVANLANNHSRDFGPEALVDSVRHVRAAGIKPVGAGANALEANAPAVVRVKGWRIAVVGFGGVVPSADWIATSTNPGMADGNDIPSMVAAVRAAGRVADLVFVVVHWGTELKTTPDADEVVRAHALIDSGADAVFGGHPHVIQPMESYKGRPIFYSLGNFVWPNTTKTGSETAVAEVRITPRGRVRGMLLPATIEDGGHPVLR